MKRWQAWENDKIADLAWRVVLHGLSVEAASEDLADAVGGTPRERIINIRAGVNAVRRNPDGHPRASRDLQRAVEERRPRRP